MAQDQQTDATIAALLAEDRTFPPPPEFKARALIKDDSIYQRAKADPEGFWAEQAESLHWFKRWDKVLTWNEPSILVYRALGAAPLNEWTVFRVAGKALEELAQ